MVVSGQSAKKIHAFENVELRVMMKLQRSFGCLNMVRCLGGASAVADY